MINLLIMPDDDDDISLLVDFLCLFGIAWVGMKMNLGSVHNHAGLIVSSTCIWVIISWQVDIADDNIGLYISFIWN